MPTKYTEYADAPFELREKKIPLRKDNDYKIVSLFGITGAGKTSLLKKLLGIRSDQKNILPTSSSRTTTHSFEVILTEENEYKACISFISSKTISQTITECLAKASKEYFNNKDIKKAFNHLFEDTKQSFRLKYILGNTNKNSKLCEKYSNILIQCSKIYNKYHNQFYTNNTDEETYDTDEKIYENFIQDDEFKSIRGKIYIDIYDTYKKIISNDNIKLEDQRIWPHYCEFSSPNRKEFLTILQNFVGNQVELWGELLTPLVEGVRISGPFFPNWLKTCSKIAFIDGKGFGHTTEASIPISYIKIFKLSDKIIVVDEATKPMQQGTINIIKGIVKHGYHKKILITFTKFDQIEGDNYEDDEAKKDQVANSFSQVCEEMKNKDDYLIVRDLENTKFFYFQQLNKENSSCIDEIENLLKEINNNISIQDKILSKKNTHTNQIDYSKKLDANIKKFLGEWDAKLNFPSQYPAIHEHWTRVKALSRRMYDFPFCYSYDTLTPVDDYVNAVQDAIYKHIKTSPLDEKLIQKLSEYNIENAIQYFKTEAISDWGKAYNRCGPGSTYERSKDIQNILAEASKNTRKKIEQELSTLNSNTI